MRSLLDLMDWGSDTFWSIVGVVLEFAWKAYLLLTLYTLWMTNMTNATKEQIATVVFVGLVVWIFVDERPARK
jgi:hypothetical protein